MSYLQMSRYLTAADFALRQVLAAEADPPPTKTTCFYARDQRSFRGALHREMADRETYPVLGTAGQLAVKSGEQPITVGSSEPAIREQEAMAAVLSSFQPVELKFDQFTAPVSGHYCARFSSYSLCFGLW